MVVVAVVVGVANGDHVIEGAIVSGVTESYQSTSMPVVEIVQVSCKCELALLFS